MKHVFFAILLTIISTINPVTTWADVEPLVSEDIDASVKQRLYPGGIDEENLKVQEELTDPLLYTSKRTVERIVRKKLLEAQKKARESSTQ